MCEYVWMSVCAHTFVGIWIPESGICYKEIVLLSMGIYICAGELWLLKQLSPSLPPRSLFPLLAFPPFFHSLPSIFKDLPSVS